MKNDQPRARLLAVILLTGSPLAGACSSDSAAPTSGGMSGSASGSGASSGASSGGTTGASGAVGGSGTAGSGATSSGTSSGDLGGSGSSGVGIGSSGSTSGSGSDADASSDADAGPDATTDAGSGSSANADGGIVDTTKPITVWLAGDSTMQPCSANACGTTPLCGWGSQFQPYFKSTAKVVDSAAGGRSIQTWLYEGNVSTMLVNGECALTSNTPSAHWQAMLDPVNGMKSGDYLFVEFGINDSFNGGNGMSPCPKHVGKALFQSYLGMMAQAAQKVGAHPIFLTSTDAIICGTGSMVTLNRAFGPETTAAGMANGVPVIDLTTLTAAFYTSKGFCPNAGDQQTTYTATTPIGLFFCRDHTHFEMAGASEIAGVVAKALRDQNIGLAAYLK